jgi:hypothetical protein
MAARMKAVEKEGAGGAAAPLPFSTGQLPSSSLRAARRPLFNRTSPLYLHEGSTPHCDCLQCQFVSENSASPCVMGRE